MEFGDEGGTRWPQDKINYSPSVELHDHYDAAHSRYDNDERPKEFTHASPDVRSLENEGVA